VSLSLYARVLWRFKWLVLVGLVLATGLAALSVEHISPGVPPKLTPRVKPVYQSQLSIMITEPGFPIGSVAEANATDSFSALASLTSLYVGLGNSQAFSSAAKRAAPFTQTVVAAPSFETLPSGYEVPIPVMTLTATADTPGHATVAATSAGVVFKQMVAKQQAEERIPKGQRIVLDELATSKPLETGGAKKTLPVLVFLIIMVGVVALALILENLRPRVSSADSEDEAAPPVSARRSA
jgi:hypothetical protein